MLTLNQSRLLMIGSAAIGCATLWLAVNIDNYVRGWAFAMPGTTDATMAPATFPRLIFSLVTVLAFAVTLTSLKEMKVAPRIETLDAKRLVVMAGSVALAFFALGTLGFVVTSLLVIVLGPLALGYRNYLAIGLTAALIAGVAWWLFRYGMNVILPQFRLFEVLS